ncbi:hypothetical protein PF008_g28272 [Phytophthora fragariae]|uniref:Uncharacterized protein n=1 Tax=Phytophthora fragariae TaxID=53985 RepID=A0A6G0QBQ8_9STRA|nr:hypothetical protein PF008_g28272 [Phytophthora fragariae]
MPTGITTFASGKAPARKKNHMSIARFDTNRTISKMINSFASAANPQTQYTIEPKMMVSASANGIWLTVVART